MDIVESTKIIDKILADSSKQREFINALIQPTTKLAQDLVNSFKVQLEPVIKQAIEFQLQFLPLWQKTLEFIEETDKSYKIAFPVLKKYNWFITPSMAASTVQIIARSIERGECTRKEINNAFLDHYCRDNMKNLEEMITEWRRNSFFEKRIKILADCLQTFRISRSNNINAANVLLPTLISQIEGIYLDYLDSKFPDGNKNKRYKFRLAVETAENHQIVTMPLHVFLDRLFQRAERGKPLNNAFNRHKIIHGEVISYGRKEHLIRAFMILDFLNYVTIEH